MAQTPSRKSVAGLSIKNDSAARPSGQSSPNPANRGYRTPQTSLSPSRNTGKSPIPTLRSVQSKNLLQGTPCTRHSSTETSNSSSKHNSVSASRATLPRTMKKSYQSSPILSQTPKRKESALSFIPAKKLVIKSHRQLEAELSDAQSQLHATALELSDLKVLYQEQCERIRQLKDQVESNDDIRGLREDLGNLLLDPSASKEEDDMQDREEVLGLLGNSALRIGLEELGFEVMRTEGFGGEAGGDKAIRFSKDGKSVDIPSYLELRNKNAGMEEENMKLKKELEKMKPWAKVGTSVRGPLLEAARGTFLNVLQIIEGYKDSDDGGCCEVDEENEYASLGNALDALYEKGQREQGGDYEES